MRHRTWLVPLVTLLLGASMAVAAYADNLVPNPDFAHGFTDWTALTSGVAVDATTGRPYPPSAHLISSNGASLASSCIQTHQAALDLFFNVRILGGTASVAINYFSDTACETDNGGTNEESIPKNLAWTTHSILGIAPNPGTQSLRIVLGGDSNDTESADVGFDDVELGVPGSVPDLVALQEGLTGTWYNPVTSGQGFLLQVPTQSFGPPPSLFAAWYTYDTSAGGADSQRWYSIEGVVTGAEILPVTIYENTGGQFDAPPVTSAVAVGSGQLSFDSCITGQLDYAFDDGRRGSIPLERLMPNIECTDSESSPTPQTDFGYSGTWYDAATAGQGFLVEINPDAAVAFAGWFTYAADGTSDGGAGQRWFSAQGAYATGSRSMNLTIYQSTGGVFDAADPVATVPVGTATLQFADCENATFDYSFSAGELSGRSGSIALTRLLGAPSICEDSHQ